MTRVASVLELIGDTPVVDVSALSPQRRTSRSWPSSRVATPPVRSRTASRSSLVEAAERDGLPGPGQARPDAARAVVGQHRHRARDGLPTARLPPQGRAADQRLARAPPAAPRLGRRDHRLAGLRGVQRRRAPRAAPRRREPRVGLPLPVRQPRQPAARTTAHRPRDPRRRARDHALRRRTGHVGHPDGRRALPQGARRPACRSGPSSRRPARWSTACAASTTVTSRRSSATTTASRTTRPQGRRASEGVHRVDAADDRGRTLRRAVVGRGMAGAVKCANSMPDDETRDDRDDRPPTTAGSTSRRERGATTSTTSSSAPSRSSTSRGGRRMSGTVVRHRAEETHVHQRAPTAAGPTRPGPSPSSATSPRWRRDRCW